MTTRSSSTLEASSGMVSGKANSLGDDTQEFLKTKNEEQTKTQDTNRSKKK